MKATLIRHRLSSASDVRLAAGTASVYPWPGLVMLSDAQDAAGQAPQMHFLNGGPEQVARELQAFIALSVRHVMLGFTDFPAHDGLRRFTQDVLPALTLS